MFRIFRFKVTNQSLQSVSRTPGPLRVQYYLNSWVEASVGGLLVFTDYGSCLEFVTGSPFRARIFKCEVEAPLMLPYRRLDVSYDYADGRAMAEVLWQNSERSCMFQEHAFPYPRELRRWPHATEAYRRVKLIEEVKYR